MNLYEIIQHEMLTDDTSPDFVSNKLKSYYKKCDQPEKAVVNSIFIELTGWSFETLQEMEIKES